MIGWHDWLVTGLATGLATGPGVIRPAAELPGRSAGLRNRELSDTGAALLNRKNRACAVPRLAICALQPCSANIKCRPAKNAVSGGIIDTQACEKSLRAM